MELYKALGLFNKGRYEECVTICTDLLRRSCFNQAVWILKMRALTLQVYVDDMEGEEEGIAESLLDNYVIPSISRPGTSLKNAHGKSTGEFLRPKTLSGRPLTGAVRPATQESAYQTIEQTLKTPRTVMTAKPITRSTSRSIRLGTTSMLTEPGGPFIQLSRLNISKHANQVNTVKVLFEYIYYHEHDVRYALDLAIQATQACQYTDWWWKIQLGKCYYTLGLVRDAERQFKSAFADCKTIEVVLRLARIYIKLDQPLSAIDMCKKGLEYFPSDTNILVEMGRIFDDLYNAGLSLKYYKLIIHQDASHTEAIANIAMHHFYNDQPELALRYYRRLLQMGVYSTELFNNLGLCCFYAQQYDHVVSCFERAIVLSTDESIADVWYNISQIALTTGDIKMAEEYLKLAIFTDSKHALAYNNLGVINLHTGNTTVARTYFHAAANVTSFIYEPHFNSACLAYKVGDLQTSYIAVQKSLKVYPDHSNSKHLLTKLNRYFSHLNLSL